MNTKPKKVKKVKVTLSITKEAQDIMLDHGYASARTMGEFISALIVDYHTRETSKRKEGKNASSKIVSPHSQSI
jgi:hypothetical protein